MVPTVDGLNRWVAEASHLWLFLDYDGTLADFPAAPDLVEVQPEIVSLIRQLSARPRFRVAVISGRKLEAIRALLPVAGVFLAGVYGVELQTPTGEVMHREEYGFIRPFLERIKPRWEKLIAGQAGFFLEDKDWSLALHARAVGPGLAERVFSAARQAADEDMPPSRFRWFGGHNFLELAPLQAHKGAAVRYLLSNFPFPDTHLVYIGDDDKDEEAFETVHAFGGIDILVSGRARPARSSEADYVLESPRSVRQWLMDLVHYE
jgi:trehalose-phosphatase